MGEIAEKVVDDDITEEVRQMGLGRCQEFLGGAWMDVAAEDFQMERIR